MSTRDEIERLLNEAFNFGGEFERAGSKEKVDRIMREYFALIDKAVAALCPPAPGEVKEGVTITDNGVLAYLREQARRDGYDWDTSSTAEGRQAWAASTRRGLEHMAATINLYLEAAAPGEVRLEDIARQADEHGWAIRFGHAGTYGYELGPHGEPWGAVIGDGEGYGWTILDAAARALQAALAAAAPGER